MAFGLSQGDCGWGDGKRWMGLDPANPGSFIPVDKKEDAYGDAVRQASIERDFMRRPVLACIGRDQLLALSSHTFACCASRRSPVSERVVPCATQIGATGKSRLGRNAAATRSA